MNTKQEGPSGKRKKSQEGKRNWKGRPFKRRRHGKDDERPAKKPDPAAVQKQLHHTLRLLRQAIRKARAFEVRKVCRRLKAAEEAAAANESEKAKGTIERLQAQREALKVVHAEDVMEAASKKYNFPEDKSTRKPEEEIANQEPLDIPQRDWAIDRILSAHCCQPVLHKVQTLLAEPEEPGGEPSKGSQETKKGKGTPKAPEDDRLTVSKGGDDVSKESDDLSIGDDDVSKGDGDVSRGSGDVSKGDDVSEGEHADVSTGGSEGDSFLMEDDDVEAAVLASSSDEDDDLTPPPSLPVGQHGANGQSKKGQEASKLKEKKAKNRLGQRERRRLAEQKYGGLAKHLKDNPPKQQHSKRGPTQDKRGSQTRRLPDKERGNRDERGGRYDRKQMSIGKDIGRVAKEVAKPKGTQAEALHPSWAAKKAQTQAMVQAGQGKKIVFDDD